MSKVKYAFYETPAGYKVTGGTSAQFLKADGSRDSTTYIPTTHAVNGITSTNISNWNTAFGWGNHAGLYAASNHSHTFASITSKPTTVAGYGITDTLTVDVSGALNNTSTVNPVGWRNKVWFDYNWAGTGNLGSVINFSGFGNNTSYSVELFGNYGDGNVFGLRTRNGDANQWSPVRYIWHTGNLDPVTTNTGQTITEHKIFTGVGDEYHNAGIEIRRTVAGKFPTLGFHQPIDQYAGTIRLKPGAFEFRDAANSFITLRASGYIVSGANNTGFLKAGGAVDYTAYAINNGLTTWESASKGLLHNITIPGHTLNSSGQTVSLQDAIQGTAAGILNSSGTAAGNPTSQWYHRIKMLHPNTAGYYTEIAVQMTGGSTMWFRTLEAGTLKNTAKGGASGWIQAVDDTNDQVISGTKTFTSSVTAPSFYESSLRKLKENIKPFEKSAIDLINKLDIVTFDRKDSSAKDKIGIIADDSPEEFLSEEKDSVDIYKTVFIQAKAIQELKAEIEELKEMIRDGR